MSLPITQYPIRSDSYSLNQNQNMHNEEISKDQSLSDFDELNSYLKKSNILDDNGNLIKELPSLQPLREHEINLIKKTLQLDYHFIGINGFYLAIQPFEILRELYLNFFAWIDSINIVGGSVNYFLTERFLRENLKLNHLEDFLKRDILNELSKPTKDLDVRIKLKPNLICPNQFYMTVQRWVCRFISKKYFLNEFPSDEESKFIWLNAFNKRKCNSSFLTFSLQDKFDWSLEIFISHCFSNGDSDHAMREYLFLSDALSIPIQDLLLERDPIHKLYLNSYLDNGWTSLFAKMTKIIGCREIHSMDKKAFPAYLVKLVKGNTDPYLEDFFTMAIHFGKLNENLNAKELFFYFDHAFRNHLDLMNSFEHIELKNQRLINAFFLGLSLVFQLKNCVKNVVIDEFLEKLSVYLHSLKDPINQNDFISILLFVLLEKKLSINVLFHFLSFKCFLWDILECSFSNFKVCKIIHSQKDVFQLHYYNAVLLLPFDLEKDIKEMYKNIENLKNCEELINFFSFNSNSNKFNKLENITINNNFILKYAELFFKNKETFKIGYELLFVSLLKNPYNDSLLLKQLPHIIQIYGLRELEKIKIIVSNHKYLHHFLCSLTEKLSFNMKWNKFLLSYIQLLLINENYRFIGWEIYSCLAYSFEEKQIFTKKLFKRVVRLNFTAAFQVYYSIHLKHSEKALYLIALQECAYTHGLPLDQYNVFNLIEEHLIEDKFSINQMALWLKTCSKYCHIRDVAMSYHIWKKGKIHALSWKEKNEKFWESYQKYLLCFLNILHESLHKDISNIIEILYSLSDHGEGPLFEQSFQMITHDLFSLFPLKGLEYIEKFKDENFNESYYCLFKNCLSKLDNETYINELKNITNLFITFLLMAFDTNDIDIKKIVLMELLNFLKKVPRNKTYLIYPLITEIFNTKYEKYSLLPLDSSEKLLLIDFFHELPNLQYTRQLQKFVCVHLNMILKEKKNLLVVHNIALKLPINEFIFLPEAYELANHLIESFVKRKKNKFLDEAFYWIKLFLKVFHEHEISTFFDYFLTRRRYDLLIQLLKIDSNLKNLDHYKLILFNDACVHDKKLISVEWNFFSKIKNKEIIEKQFMIWIKKSEFLSELNDFIILFQNYRIIKIDFWLQLIQKEIFNINLVFRFSNLEAKKKYIGSSKIIEHFIYIFCENQFKNESRKLAFIFLLIMDQADLPLKLLHELYKHSKLFSEILMQLSDEAKIKVIQPLAIFSFKENEISKIDIFYESVIKQITIKNELILLFYLHFMTTLCHQGFILKACNLIIELMENSILEFENKNFYVISNLLILLAEGLENCRNQKDHNIKSLLIHLLKILDKNPVIEVPLKFLLAIIKLKDKLLLIESCNYVCNLAEFYSSLYNIRSFNLEKRRKFIILLNLFKNELQPYKNEKIPNILIRRCLEFPFMSIFNFPMSLLVRFIDIPCFYFSRGLKKSWETFTTLGG